MRFNTLSAWLIWLEQQHPITIDLGLDRIRQVASQMGLQKPLAKVITVAGTNGKGSFVACAQALLLAHGKQVAAYTSPHLLHFNERIQINGQCVSDAQLMHAFDKVDCHLNGVSLSYFEFTTLAALWIFSQTTLDVVLLEVGLGGRLDAVNILAPDVAVITSIDFDHQDYLGDTLDKIAAEKCGILRSDTPLICSQIHPPSVLLNNINNRVCDWISRDFFVEETEHEWTVTAPRYFEGKLTLQRNGLSEPSQAAAICFLYQYLGEAANQPLIKDVQASLVLPGRFQKFQHNGVTIILDVAHNTQAITLLKKRLQMLPKPAASKRIAVFNMLQDKDIDGAVSALHDVFDAWFLGELDTPRAIACEELANKLQALGQAKVSQSKNIRQAFARAMSICQPGDQIVAMGSFYVVAEMLKKLETL